MFQVGTENRWLSHDGFNMMADFCVWALEKDGLQVPPFDAHPDGDGTLRSAGLQAQEWRLWTTQAIQLQYPEFRAPLQPLKTESALPSLLLADPHNPPTNWGGNARVG